MSTKEDEKSLPQKEAFGFIKTTLHLAIPIMALGKTLVETI